MQTKINELGRSMVEILGVLAVIGVLSVGGIIGYKYAMNKYIANETVNELAIRANDIAYQMDKLIEANYVGEIEMELGNTTRMGYPIMARMSPQYEEYFEIFLSEVPSDICKLLLQSQWQSPYSIFVGIEEYEATPDICNSAEKVELAYEFYKDLTGKDELKEEAKHQITRCHYDHDCKCGTCEQGICASYCPVGAMCANSYSDTRSWQCCLEEYVVNGVCCASVQNGQCCNESGDCCPESKPVYLYNRCCPKNYFLANNNVCYDCNTPSNGDGIFTTQAECNKCSNRELNADKGCYLKCGVEGTETADKPVMEVRGRCASCSDSKIWIYQPAEYKACIDKCPNMRVDRSTTEPGGYCYPKCPNNKPLMTVGGACQDCDYDKPVHIYSVSGECSTVCPNRELGGKDNMYCIKACPSDKPLISKTGTCYSCDEKSNIDVTGITENCTNVCGDKRYLSGNSCILKECGEGYFRDTSNNCVSCDEKADGNGTWATQTECNKCTNRALNADKGCYLKCGVEGTETANSPVMEVRGRCASCSDSKIWIYQPAEYKACIDKCPNMRVDRSTTEPGGYCYPKCSNNKPLMTTGGACQDCDYDKPVHIYSVSGECSTVCPNRKLGGKDNMYCIKACPSDKPLISKTGTCYSCDEKSNIDVTGITENCTNVCGDKRYLSGNSCILKECGEGYFRDNSNNCVSCDEKADGNGRWATLAECNKCPNRELNGDKGCYLKCGIEGTETAGKPLMNVRGYCYSCDVNEKVWMYSASDFPKCNEICSNRKMDSNGYCIKEMCSSANPLEDKSGYCYPCNYATPVDVAGSAVKCSVCLNRTLDGDNCILSLN